MSSSIILTAIVLLILLSIIYVYKFRGEIRFENLTEYLRKGWPLFAPLNCLLYVFTKSYAKKPIINPTDFPKLKEIQDNWHIIAEEGKALLEQKMFEKTKDPNSSAYYDIGFRTFYKYGWGKFYLNWYGKTHPSARRTCPKTVEILSKIPQVNGAMFSVLPVGSKLTRHLDPVACSLRYHLGLFTPNSDKCFINVDGTDYSWRDGESFIFDETYLHYAKNNSENTRLILMCDIERPMFFIGTIVNFIYKLFMRATVVPNTNEDPKGLTNKIFSWLAPILAKSKALKQTNKPIYTLIKYTVNIILIVLGFLIIKLFVHFLSYILA